MRVKFLTTAALAVALSAGGAAADGISHLPLLSDISTDAEAISPHIPQMGEHWAEPANLPLGPIYCVIEGHVVCVEYMFLASQLNDGISWMDMATGMETPPITFITMEYLPDGVGPIPEPLYQLHLYFAEREVLAEY